MQEEVEEEELLVVMVPKEEEEEEVVVGRGPVRASCGGAFHSAILDASSAGRPSPSPSASASASPSPSASPSASVASRPKWARRSSGAISALSLGSACGRGAGW